MEITFPMQTLRLAGPIVWITAINDNKICIILQQTIDATEHLCPKREKQKGFAHHINIVCAQVGVNDDH